MKPMTKERFIEMNIQGTRVTAEQYVEIYDVVECTCGDQCPGWRTNLKEEKPRVHLEEPLEVPTPPEDLKQFERAEG